MYELRHDTTPEGQDLFAQWLSKLRDRYAQARIAARLLRLQNGNFGECRCVGGGVWEQKIDWGAGYRVYYAIEGKNVVLFVMVATNAPKTQILSAPSLGGASGSKGVKNEPNEHKRIAQRLAVGATQRCPVCR